MSMSWKPVNRHLWSPECAVMFGYQDPYDKHRQRDRQPDAIIIKIDGQYKCAIGPDYNQDFVAVEPDGESAKYACLMALVERQMTPTKTPTVPASASRR